jgi:organic radical activating enzyme
MTPHDMPIGNTKENTLEDVWNGFAMTNIRKKMFKGERPFLCNRCYLMDDNMVESPRVSMTGKFLSQVPEMIKNTDINTGHNKDFMLKYWDFRFSNICNFKCRMCGTFASSKWSEDENAIHGNTNNTGLMNFRTESKEDIMIYVDKFINDVQEIYFAGGEPLIMDEHYIILEKLINVGRTDITLRYNTNFSHIKFKKWDLLKLWSPFIKNPKGRIELFASLDATEKTAEIIRHGTVWRDIYNNIEASMKLGVDIFVSPTISILNAFHLTELFDTIMELEIMPEHIVYNNLLTDSQCFDIRILPEDLKEDLTNMLEDYHSKLPESQYKEVFERAISGWINFLYSEINIDLLHMEITRRELLRVNAIMDLRRSENFLDVNPQYIEWFEEIRQTIKNYETEEYFFRDRSVNMIQNEIPKTII